MKNSIKRYLPIEYKKDIFEINYDNLLKCGFDTIFFDLDNTIADYYTFIPSNNDIKLMEELKKKGFKIYLVSNNNKKRVDGFKKLLKIEAYYHMLKPFKVKINKLIKNEKLEKNKIIWIGDQLVTDSKCAIKLDIKMILVDPINLKSEHWYTKINRKFEKRIILKLKKRCYKEFIELGLDKRWIY